MSCSVSWETVAGLSSAVIALCALVFTIWQSCVQRKHNRLSVKPYLTTWSHTDEGLDYIVVAVDLLNNGVGPALIKTFKVYVDGTEIKGQESELISKSVKLLFPNYDYQINHSFVSHGYMMASKEKRNLVLVRFDGASRPKLVEIEHAKERVDLKIEYESIFQEAQPPFDTSKTGLN